MGKVKIYEKKMTIPTYGIGEADKNPMFLEKRVYQASKGNVYPYPFIEKVYDEKFAKEYNVVILENDYIQLVMMPELGGRIQYGYDKVNDYDFFYRNNVIKPALVGLAGPWISGGVEFNWPQHHRPSTFDPVEYKIIENEDGSKTLCMGEIEKMSRMVGQVYITVYPDKSYVEVEGRSYNNTAMPQNFLWWANIAVHVHDKYESFFPQDVKFVADHGKRDMTAYPYADKIYYNVDYPSLDLKKRNITNYDNIPVPMSYMAMGSNYDFFGGYDYNKDMGTMYISNHHIAPGKKQWTWGCGDFGIAWDRQLTDEDGPYAELMAGVYTDNQPDFTWINPFEQKSFYQYWYPFKSLGKVKNANLYAAVNIDYNDGAITYDIGTPAHLNECTYQVHYKDTIILEEKFSLTPKDKVISGNIKRKIDDKLGLGIRILSKDGNELLNFVFKEETKHKDAKPAIEALRPEKIETIDELYLIGTHLEQYRHATYDADDYYLEGLKRNPNDIRCNTAYAMLLLKQHDYKNAIPYFKKSIALMTKYNPNPKNCEAYYGLGLCRMHKQEYSLAYDAFYKAVWDYSYRSAAYMCLSQIDCINNDYNKALEHINLSLVTNSESTRARNLKMLILLEVDDKETAKKWAQETVSLNPLSYLSINELDVLNGTDDFKNILFGNTKTYFEVALEYGDSGFYEKATNILNEYISLNSDVYPMVYYLLGYYYKQLNHDDEKIKYYNMGESANRDYCFPHRVQEKIVLLDAISEITAPSAAYYLGNLLYDKKDFEKAINYFELSAENCNDNATLYRNLGIGYFNVHQNIAKATKMYEKAHKIDSTDGRILYELDQLYKLNNKQPADRIKYLKTKMDIVVQRDDLYLEYITLTNELGEYDQSLELLSNHNFHPFEGGEGKISEQYKFAKIQKAKHLIELNKCEKAIQCLEDAKFFPINLGEGKIYGTPEADINYYLGVCYKNLNDTKAKQYFEMSAQEKVVSSSKLSYKPEKLQMNYYQGLSMIELGYLDKAKKVFEELIDYHMEKAKINAQIDYFAISVPEFLIFTMDLNAINKSHCYYIIGLGYLGLDDKANAKKYFDMCIKININHIEAKSCMSYL